MMGKPIIMVSGADLVAELSDETRFDKTVRGALRRIRGFAGDGLFTAYTTEPNWQKAHNILLPNFSQRAMLGYHDAMLDIAVQLCQRWARLNTDDEIDVVRDMISLTLDTIGLAGFDYRFNSFYREKNHPFVNAMVRALELTMETRGLPLEHIVRMDREIKLKSDAKYMNKIVDRIIKERRESGEDLSRKQDLLSYMLTGVDKKSGQRLDDTNIRYQIITFLIAGHETTSGLLSFTIYYLLQNPDVMAKAVAEVDRVFGTDPSKLPTYQQVTQLTYVTQVLKESLRLWPTAPAYSVSPYKETTIGGKYTLRPEHMISILVPSLHRDRKVWGERAEVFDPENFTREAEAKRAPSAYKPFGNGQRACIGRQFAMQEAALVLGMVLQRFELIDHARYQLAIKESLTLKPDGLKIKIRARRPMQVLPAALNGAATPQATPATEKPTKRPGHGTPLLVLYGSNLGTAEGVARQIAEAGEANGFEATLAELDEHVGTLPTEGAVVIATSSYNGGPPDNAMKFCDWLNTPALSPDALKGVTYAVFGCGNRDWASTFQTIPRMIDEKLAAHGARRMAPRGEADARDDFDSQFQDWFGKFWPQTASALGVTLADASAVDNAYDVEVVHGGLMPGFVESLGARDMSVVVNRELHNQVGAHASDRSTRHIELTLPPGTTYRAGDHLGVIPRNADDLIRRAADRFGLSPAARIKITSRSGRKSFLPVDQPVSVERLLADYVELQDVATRKQIQMMAQATRCPATRPKLEALGGDDEAAQGRYRAEVFAKRKSVLDLMEDHPACELQFGTFLEMLPPLRPRYYSISSSPLELADRCSISVAVVDGPARSGRGTYRGVCSNYLARQDNGARVHAFVKDTKSSFRLPTDPTTPIIMVGPGTGLAPFIGFLQERAKLKEKGQSVGPSVLFFGCRHPDTDFIYRQELEAYQREGLTALKLAYSRIQGQPKVYVQDLIAKERDALWELIAKGAVIYVCGDAGKMAPAVRKAFGAIIAEKSGCTAEEADSRLTKMTDDGRYLVDVWASS
jgi:cytochrome P450/NADPH-cytochrome P450 reductase